MPKESPLVADGLDPDRGSRRKSRFLKSCLQGPDLRSVSSPEKRLLTPMGSRTHALGHSKLRSA
jgi:hypothetical protein